MSLLMRRAIPFVLLATLSACGKKPDSNSPLAFVPADTPYVLANLEPVPQTVIDEWSRLSREAWPLSLNMYTRMLDKAEDKENVAIKAARAVLEEINLHVANDTVKELGFKGSTHIAIYGVGILPVVRLQLSDANALRATVARVEAKSGAKLPTAKLADQDYWAVELDKMTLMMAIINDQLVLTLAPQKASEALRSQLLGLTRPSKSLAEVDTLSALNKQYAYTSAGSGYVDTVRIVEFLTDANNPLRREMITALALPEQPIDPVCTAEFLQIAKKFPRMVMGYTDLSGKRMTLHAQLEIEPTLAQALAAASGSAPGSASKAEGLLDFTLSFPVLKQKDFWLKQAKAAIEKPYACAELAELNDMFARMKQTLDTTIPPPASDFTGLRASVSTFSMDAASGKPDGAGKLLIALTNPASALAMGQLAMAQLKDLTLLPDGKPVAVPATLLPPGSPPLFAAMTDKALAISAGTGEESGLSAYLAAPAAAEPVVLRVYFSGRMYGQFGSLFDKFSAMMPTEQRADLEDQKKIFALYEKTIHHAEFSITAKPTGVALIETVEMN